MVRGRTSAPQGLSLGHEITGEVVEIGECARAATRARASARAARRRALHQPHHFGAPLPRPLPAGRDVETLSRGDIVTVPFNIACGRCDMCKRGLTGICLRTNPARPGAAYGYVDMGGWRGGQARYVTVPYADWNLFPFADRAGALEKIADIALLSDILPTGYHGAVTAGVGPGKSVYIAGAGPVGLAAAVGARLLGAAVVIVGDLNAERLAHARAQGFETVDVSKGPAGDQIAAIMGGDREVDCGVDCVGFEARGCGHAHAPEQPAQVLNDMMALTRAGGACAGARRRAAARRRGAACRHRIVVARRPRPLSLSPPQAPWASPACT
jgi:glutathione-independent formaldehyde dehydrogenase